jgi:hypothetical protein
MIDGKRLRKDSGPSRYAALKSVRESSKSRHQGGEIRERAREAGAKSPKYSQSGSVIGHVGNRRYRACR